MYKHFKDNIGSLECQAIADRVWSKFDKLLFGKANKVCFDRFGEYNTIENKWNKSGLKYSDGFIIWIGLKIPVIIKQNDIYAQTAIQDNIKFCRIVRKLIRGKYKYYVQFMIEVYVCECGYTEDRDYNASLNLRDAKEYKVIA